MNIISENERANERAYERCMCETRGRSIRRCNSSPEGGKAILRCGAANAGPLPILGTQGLIPALPIPVGSVSIDTSCLCNSSILVNVNLLINTPAALLSSLTFRIVRSINGSSQPIGGSYTFSDAIEALSSNSFSFSFCDNSSGCGFVTYSVEVTSATLLQAGTTIGGTITALAVENR